MKCKLCEKEIEYDWEFKFLADGLTICKNCFDIIGEEYKEDNELFTKEEIGSRLMGGGFR